MKSTRKKGVKSNFYENELNIPRCSSLDTLSDE